jgi:hypothetical protein
VAPLMSHTSRDTWLTFGSLECPASLSWVHPWLLVMSPAFPRAFVWMVGV